MESGKNGLGKDIRIRAYKHISMLTLKAQPTVEPLKDKSPASLQAGPVRTIRHPQKKV